VRGLASHFVWLNRSKESLTLDLKRDEARDVLSKLLRRADVFVQNLAPGAAERLGLGVNELRATYPQLIACGLSGYGTTGPYATKKAYDLLVQSETGLVSITGTDQTPSKVGLSIADIAGGMYVYSGVLTALLQRARTGQGTAFEVSLFEALGEWMGYAMYYSFGGAPPARTGASHAAIAPYGPYKTRDGQVIFGVHNNREWAIFCRHVLERPGLADDPRFRESSARRESHGDGRGDRRCVRAAADGRRDSASRFGADRQRADEHARPVRRAPAAQRAGRVADGGIECRIDSRARAAGPHGRRRARHGPDSRARRTHGFDSRRARVSSVEEVWRREKIV
jgi:crotonobetainyl-CoA:carnitine CoA-transferase CaiB-like acyl-CoA transferase